MESIFGTFYAVGVRSHHHAAAFVLKRQFFGLNKSTKGENKMELEGHVESFGKLATERLPDGLWRGLHETVIGLLSVHLLGRLCFRLFARIAELENRLAKLEEVKK